MKLMVFNDDRVGVVRGDSVVDVTAAVEGVPHTDAGNLMSAVVARFADLRAPIERAAAAGAVHRASQQRPQRADRRHRPARGAVADVDRSRTRRASSDPAGLGAADDARAQRDRRHVT